MPVRGPSEKQRRIFWMQSSDRCRHDICELVVLDPVPDVEEEDAPQPQHALNLPVCRDTVREEHD